MRAMCVYNANWLLINHSVDLITVMNHQKKFELDRSLKHYQAVILLYLFIF